MKNKKILFADDDPDIREALYILLTSEGYDVIMTKDGKELLEQIDDTVDLVILDIMMPEINGYIVCSEIRKNYSVPILFLTAKSQDSDKTLGFSVGGDDYLVKPFSYNELISRVKAIIRRYYVYGSKETERNNTIYCCGNVEIDTEQCIVKVDNKEVNLTDIEYRILLLLASHRQRIYSAQNIYELIWDEPYTYSSNNTIVVHIRNIRRKLNDNSQNSRTIRNVWGKGYRID